MPTTTFEESLFERLVEDPDAPTDLSEAQETREPANFFRHAGSLAMTKLADGLIDPKLVLSWLMTALGAPAALTGLLVPIREAGALLPQLFTASAIHGMKRRKWAWAGGSLVQGLAAGAIALAALTLEGATAGVAICAALAVLALARSVCSVSYKDVLGRTVGKARRGTVTGTASSVGAGGVILFALLLMLGAGERMVLVTGAIILAAGLWIAASLLFSTLWEEANPGDDERQSLRAQLSLLREDAQLVRFIVTRGLLTATALAPPFLVILASEGGSDALGTLGALVLASALASLVSSYVWGRLADRSSRKVLIRAGLAGAGALALAVALSVAGLFGNALAAPGVLFLLMIAYHGVRQGRSTYLVDMAPEDRRADYAAVSNTVIGLILLASGAFGALASLAGVEVTLAAFAAMCAGAAWVGIGLEEVEGDTT
ncbi:MFS transporter [Roseobacter sp. HKCCA0434]|uniref:MFS transporter n=1 Tax=Roseobacter sp. HKCCA0434 TaxID=3079297 RepID=UPI002905F1E5|nr:MFS transporter [Roseobacter sp. HKCCA0434]